MQDVWKLIPNFPNYEISSTGIVRNIKRKTILAAHAPRGYLRVTLYKGGKSYKKFVHRLVIESFLGVSNNESKIQVNHIDEDKTNNSLANLEWMTAKENVNHGTGIKRRAYKQRNQKSTSVQVAQLTISGELISIFPSMKEAQRKTGISVQEISMCCSNKISKAKNYIFKKIEKD